ALTAVVGAIDGDQRGRIADGGGAEDEFADDGEDGCVCGDAEADGEKHDEDESGGAGETAQSVSEIAPEHVGGGFPACMPDLVLDDGGASYLGPCGANGV